MPTARRGSNEFVNEPGNGLDAFGSEGAPLLELVEAYPEPELHPPASLRLPREAPRLPVTFRHRAASAVRAIRTAMLFPFVVVAWFTLRVWWLIRLTLSGIWHAITAGVSLVGFAIIASGRGARNLAVGTVRLPVRAVMTVVLTVRAVVDGTGRAIAHGAMLVRSATLAVAHGIAAAIAFVAEIARAVMAVVLTVRAAVYGTGRAIAHGAFLIRSATLAAAHGIAAAIAFVAGTIARAVMAVVLTVRAAVAGIGRAIAHGALLTRSATLATAGGIAGASAFVATMIARTVASVVAFARTSVRVTVTALASAWIGVVSAMTALVLAGRAGVAGIGRAIAHGALLIRSATLAAARGIAGAIAFVAAMIVRTVASVIAFARTSVRVTVTALASGWNGVVSAMTAFDARGRAGVAGIGRAIAHGALLIRSSTLAAARGIAGAVPSSPR